MSIAVTELPRQGFGSIEFFNKAFNFEAELARAIAVISEFGNAGILAVKSKLEIQVLTFLTEWGAGLEALTIQPQTNYLIKSVGNEIQVFQSETGEYGSETEPFLKFTRQPEAIAEGLHKTFEGLLESDIGEGMVTYSPGDFYKEWESTSDVINPIVVTKINKQQNGKIESVEATGWFLFIKRMLPNNQRAFLNNIAGLTEQQTQEMDTTNPELSSTSDETGESFIEKIVGKPQKFILTKGVVTELNGEVSTNTILPFAHKLEEAFNARFDINLFKQADETLIMRRIQRYVKEHIQGLVGLLLKNNKLEFLKKLFGLTMLSQKEWAIEKGINWRRHLLGIENGEIQIIGFEVGLNESKLVWDSSTNSWVEQWNCEVCGSSYNGESCPNCG